MTIRRHHDPDAFLAAAAPLVVADRARYASLRVWARSLPDAAQERSFMATWTRDDAAGAAFQRGDGPVIIGASARDAAIAFAEALFEEHPGLAGVVGSFEACEAFNAAWRARSGRVARLRLRLRGYASALVGAMCAELVEARREVFLVTDVANPTSNALYARLGFVPLAESCHFDLVEPD